MFLNGSFESKLRKRNRAIIIGCDDSAYFGLLTFIHGNPEHYLIYSKSSTLKLVVNEEGF